MATSYAAEIQADVGETFHIKGEVRSKSEHYVPFTISSAVFELLDQKGNTESEGECTVDGHYIDALIEFSKSGIFYVRFTYVIGDETWVDKIKVKVG